MISAVSKTLYITFIQVARPCSVSATISGGIVAMKMPATGMNEATNVKRLKKPSPDILEEEKLINETEYLSTGFT